MALAEMRKPRGQVDIAHIDVNDAWQMRFWTKELGATEQQIQEAVLAVGVDAQAVRQYFKQ